MYICIHHKYNSFFNLQKCDLLLVSINLIYFSHYPSKINRKTINSPYLQFSLITMYQKELMIYTCLPQWAATGYSNWKYFFSDIANISVVPGNENLFIKLTSVFHASVLLLIMNFVITLSKQLWIHEAIAEWICRLLWQCYDETHCQ